MGQPALAQSSPTIQRNDAANAAYHAGDLGRARELWQAGCDAGTPGDCYEVAIMYRDGEGMPADEQRANALLVTACDGGVANACHNLGSGELRAVEQGTGTVPPEQLARGLAYYQRACDLGARNSCTNLAMHQAREAANAGHDEASLAAMQATCTNGAGEACFALASLYDVHIGGDLGDDRDSANQYLLLGCERLHYDSCQNLAWHYDHGFGLEQDRVRGSALYHLACNDDPGYSCVFLGSSSYAARPDGDAPVLDQWRRAAGAYRAACDQGLAIACFGMARLIAKSGNGRSHGEVMRANLERALALSPGMPIATELLRRLDAGELPEAPVIQAPVL